MTSGCHATGAPASILVARRRARRPPPVNKGRLRREDLGDCQRVHGAPEPSVERPQLRTRREPYGRNVVDREAPARQEPKNRVAKLHHIRLPRVIDDTLLEALELEDLDLDDEVTAGRVDTLHVDDGELQLRDVDVLIAVQVARREARSRPASAGATSRRPPTPARRRA